MQAQIPPLVKQDIEGAIAAGAVVVAHNESQEKAGLPHSDSAVSLPSNASSVHAPGTPVAPSVVTGTTTIYALMLSIIITLATIQKL